MGYALNWDLKEGRKTRSITLVTGFDLEDREGWPGSQDWIIGKRLEFEAVFRPLVRELF